MSTESPDDVYAPAGHPSPGVMRTLLKYETYLGEPPFMLVCPNCSDNYVHLRRVHLVFVDDYLPAGSVSYDLCKSPAAETSQVEVPLEELAQIHGKSTRGSMLVLELECEVEEATFQVTLGNHKAQVHVGSTVSSGDERLWNQAHARLHEVLTDALAATAADGYSWSGTVQRRHTVTRRAATVRQSRCQAVRAAFFGDWCHAHAPRQFQVTDRLMGLLQESSWRGGSPHSRAQWAQQRLASLEDLREQLAQGPEPLPSEEVREGPLPSPRKRSGTKADSAITITARFPSDCTSCDRAICTGDIIQRDPHNSSWRHYGCPAVSDQDEAAEPDS